LLAALASWLDARANAGKWLIRMEDLDPPRERAGMAEAQIATLARFGMRSDEPIVYQSARLSSYEAALELLQQRQQTFLCACSRSSRIGGSSPVPLGACPRGCRMQRVCPPAAVRFVPPSGVIGFQDRACGWFEQDVARELGDFIVRRIDGLWAYQLAVVVDDAHQGITDVVRGADLLDNTPRQIRLQQALGVPTPRYLHVPLVVDATGKKLSKQDKALPLDESGVLAELAWVWNYLGFAPIEAHEVDAFLAKAVERWRNRFCGTNARVPGAA
jgi:glutamyl-Q tRNA(Asp) synthetase